MVSGALALRSLGRRGASSTGCLVSLLILVAVLYYGVNGLPDQAQNVRIVRRASPREIAIEAQYSETIHLPLFTHTFTFHPKATQPL